MQSPEQQETKSNRKEDKGQKKDSAQSLLCRNVAAAYVSASFKFNNVLVQFQMLHPGQEKFFCKKN